MSWTWLVPSAVARACRIVLSNADLSDRDQISLQLLLLTAGHTPEAECVVVSSHQFDLLREYYKP